MPPTLVPQATVTPTPAPYRGYALTLWQAALRTGVIQTDESILEMLPADSLVYVSGQTYVDGVAWSSVQAVRSGNFGFMPHEVFRPISNEEARPYLEQMQPAQQATQTPAPSQVYGYAMTVGEGVPMRTFPDTNAEIIRTLPYGAVASVQGQQYADGTTWHLVQFGGMWGFIRQDQMRMLSPEESQAYELSLQGSTPTPTPAPTLEPVTPDSLSCYGHVKSASGKVNLRSEPSLDSNRLRLLDNYAFALVRETITNDEGVWYHVTQAGTDGYISGDYFKVLTSKELADFLQSDNYRNANSTDSSSGNSSSQLQPVEDYNQTVWKNPSLNTSYEPFNPYLTPTPNPEALPTATIAPTLAPTSTAFVGPIGPTGMMTTTQPTTPTSGGSVLPWVLLVIAVLGGGGAYYAYTIYRRNERRRQAVRAQQARQARAAQPQMRQARNNPGPVSQATRTYQNVPSYMPPQGGAPRPPQPPQDAPAASGAEKKAQDTNPYRPVTRRQVEAYRPDETQAYRPKTPVQRQETQAFAPSQLPQRQEPSPFRPQEPSQETHRFAPVQLQTDQETRAYSPTRPTEAGTVHQRQRRVDRHRDRYDESDQ